ncbi:hypothetical protein LT493_10885 [Streptomyces tricolor]|nr:hypothetical protein [Streptomyces tricolor]
MNGFQRGRRGPGRPSHGALLLHGAGTGARQERLLPFPCHFAAQGCRALAFDFSGHGGEHEARAPTWPAPAVHEQRWRCSTPTPGGRSAGAGSVSA